VRKPKGKRRLGRPRLRWENYIKVNLQEFGCEGRTGSNRLRMGIVEGTGICDFIFFLVCRQPGDGHIQLKHVANWNLI
jgi:hypothetical protein